MPDQIIVTYLHHSGFMVQVADRLLLFDYYCDPRNPDQKVNNKNTVIAAIQDSTVKRIDIFVSHRHQDHYDASILTFDRFNKPVSYLLSSDITADLNKEQVYYLDPDEEIIVDDLIVRTFGSTDEGVSFLVDMNGLRLFHAGDLNWWYWFDESTADELAEAEHSFKTVIQTIVDHVGQKTIDIAFFPVDPRLKSFEHYGGEYFIDQLKPRYFFPMHFAYDYATTRLFKKRIQDSFSTVAVSKIEHERQQFILDL